MSNSTNPYKPKLVIVLSRFPYPIDKGDKLRAFYQIRDLSEKWDIYLHCISEIAIDEKSRNTVAAYCKEVHIHRLNKILIYLNCGLQLLGNKPFQVAYFFQRHIQKKIQRSLLEIRPDHIFCQLIRASEYVKNYHHCSKTLDYMDALSEGIKRRISTAPFMLRFLFRSEWKRLMRYENLVFDYFEKHTIISEQDKNLIAHAQKSKIDIIPNGVGEHFFNYSPNKEPNFELVFVGNLNYPPNIAAVHFIAKDILPLSVKNGHNWKILIAGANPSEEILQLTSNNIEISGWVDDIRTNYAAGKIFIAPMFIGTGLQNKLLEAMAMGLPCITTSLAKNALENNDNQIIEANNSAEFVVHIEELLHQSSFYTEISKKNKEYVHQHFNWKTINTQLSELMLLSILPKNV